MSNYVLLSDNRFSPINKSTTYVLPMLADKITYFNSVLSCYLKDKQKSELSNHFFVLHSTEALNKEYVETRGEHPNFEELYYPTTEFLMVAYKVPESRSTDINKFKAGKYSSLDPYYKAHILAFYSAGGYNTLKIRQVLYKDPKLKEEMEKDLMLKIPNHLDLSDPPLIHHETFNVESFT